MSTKYWQYKRVADLNVGVDLLVNTNGNLVSETIQRIEKVRSTPNDTFYRLNVESVDNYFANGILAHNSEENKVYEDAKAKKAADKLKECAGWAVMGGGGSNFISCLDDKGCIKKGADGKQDPKCKEKVAAATKKICGLLDGLPKDETIPVPGDRSIPKKTYNPFCKLVSNSAIGSDKCRNNCDAMRETVKAVKDNCGGGKTPGDCCLHTDTLISTPSGLVAVGDLNSGDVVTSYKLGNEIDGSDKLWSAWYSDTYTGTLSQSTVISNYSSEYYYHYEIETSTGRKLKITYEHPLLVLDEGKPIRATLSVGLQNFLGSDHKSFTIVR